MSTYRFSHINCFGFSCTPCLKSVFTLLSCVLYTVTGCLNIDAVWRIGGTSDASFRTLRLQYITSTLPSCIPVFFNDNSRSAGVCCVHLLFSTRGEQSYFVFSMVIFDIFIVNTRKCQVLCGLFTCTYARCNDGRATDAASVRQVSTMRQQENHWRGVRVDRSWRVEKYQPV